MRPVYLETTTINDAWYQLLWNIYDFGRREKIDRGSYAGDTRLEFDWVVCRIKYPGKRPLAIRMPESSPLPPPNDDDAVEKYFAEYLMGGQKRPDEQYTYGERLVNYTSLELEPYKDKFFVNTTIINQVQHVIDTYKQFGFRNNQMILTVGQPGDVLLEDPPCLRHIDTRIQNENGELRLHFYPYFRSNDLWNGWPTNLAGIQLLKEYMASEIGVEDGEIIYSSKGLHLYGHIEDVAKMRLCRSDL